MKKQALAALFAAQLMTQLHAGGDIEGVETVEAEEHRFYFVAKGLATFGDEVEHGEAILDGDGGYGFGIDIGYRLGNGFNLEYDFSYAKNTVAEKREGFEPEDFNADYYTSALDLVYVYEVTETVGIFGKVGYEYEWEKIDELSIDSTDHGFVFGAGMEIAINENYRLVMEYEHSTIDSPRGDSLFVGIAGYLW